MCPRMYAATVRLNVVLPAAAALPGAQQAGR